jgi:predicted TIM-barrel fold metal-dependent hydrolase
VEGRIYPKYRGKGVGIQGKIRGGSRMTQRPAGLVDARARLPDMDLDGVDVAVLFGGLACLGAGAFRDAELGAAMARAYNDWVANYAAHDPARLKPVAALPLQDPLAAGAELRRCVAEYGFVGLAMPPNLNRRHLGDAYFDPIYALAEELDVPVCVHGTAPRPGIHVTGMELFDTFFMAHMPHHCFDQMLACLAVIGGGVLDRFPRLRFAFLEGWCGWLPFWMERMEEHYDKLAEQLTLRHSPAEYLAEGHLYFACEPGEQSLAYVAARVGAERLIYASDYWHWDADFPGTVAKIAGRTDLSDGQKRLILAENAARLFRLPVPATVG